MRVTGSQIRAVPLGKLRQAARGPCAFAAVVPPTDDELRSAMGDGWEARVSQRWLDVAGASLTPRSRWLRLAPFIHPSCWSQQSPYRPHFSMVPLQAHGDAAISLAIALASLLEAQQHQQHQQQQQQQRHEHTGPAPRLGARAAADRLHDAAFLSEVMRASQLAGEIKFDVRRANAAVHRAAGGLDLSRLVAASGGGGAADAPDDICVAALVGVVGAIYVDHGLSNAARFALAFVSS